MPGLRRLQHGMLLDSKTVMDDAMPDLEAIKELIPERLHKEFETILEQFEDTLCGCDVADEFTEK
jgi:hypothetical protein